MAGVITNYSKFEIHTVARILQAERVCQKEMHHKLMRVYGQKVISRKEVCVWWNKFKGGRPALNYNPEKHRDRPRTLRTDADCVIVKGLMWED
jgi:hypothetical protein